MTAPAITHAAVFDTQIPSASYRPGLPNIADSMSLSSEFSATAGQIIALTPKLTVPSQAKSKHALTSPGSRLFLETIFG